MDELPDELLFHILKHLNNKQLQKCFIICKRIKHIITNNYMYLVKKTKKSIKIIKLIEIMYNERTFMTKNKFINMLNKFSSIECKYTRCCHKCIYDHILCCENTANEVIICRKHRNYYKCPVCLKCKFHNEGTYKENCYNKYNCDSYICRECISNGEKCLTCNYCYGCGLIDNCLNKIYCNACDRTLDCYGIQHAICKICLNFIKCDEIDLAERCACEMFIRCKSCKNDEYVFRTECCGRPFIDCCQNDFGSYNDMRVAECEKCPRMIRSCCGYNSITLCNECFH